MKCSFCSKDIERGTGKIYVQNDGRVFYFCTMKCEKNQIKLKRKGWDHKWTKTYKDMKGKKVKDKAKKAESKQEDTKQEAKKQTAKQTMQKK
jgi:large subunit ribosomal protein L24e